MSVSWSSNDGDSWQRVQLSDTGPAAVWALAVAASNTAIVYAGGHVNYAGAIRRSTDFGRTWAETPAPNGRVWGLAVHPDDENTVYAAALDSCWKTTDAGTTWRRVGGGYYLYDVCLYPGSPDTVIVGGRYGVAISTDGGTTWQQFNTGLTSTSVTCLRIVDDNGAVRLYAGTAGGGLHVYSFETGVDEWRPVNARPGFEVRPTVVRRSDRVRLQVPVAGVGQVTLFDGSGRLQAVLAEGELGRGALETALPEGLARGAYLVRFVAGGQIATAKLVVR